MKELAESIANEIFNHLEPELHRAMVEKIIAVASEKWRMRYMGDAEISQMIENGIEQALGEKYKSVLDYIADKKAREKVLKRAQQNGIDVEEMKSLFNL